MVLVGRLYMQLFTSMAVGLLLFSDVGPGLQRFDITTDRSKPHLGQENVKHDY